MMKLKTKFKMVEYFGLIFQLSYKYKYLAVDKSGKLYAYVTEPNLNESIGMFVTTEKSKKIAKVDLTGIDWKETCRPVIHTNLPSSRNTIKE